MPISEYNCNETLINDAVKLIESQFRPQGGAEREVKRMSNIASYQEGFNDGYTQAREDTRERAKKRLMEFISEQREEDPQQPYSRGYNMCLKDLEEFIEVL